ncbi:MAG: AbrB/MazE/SpoVT family DNA-binding domain-containing protein [Desulfurococcales archaeon]|nr:AbrB/MazE/SpoVT family DNA-binding domain-containing protein [Desulfurococcales archaeon]
MPKAIREAAGIDESDEVVVEDGDGIIIKPVKRRVNEEEVRRSLRAHLERLGEVRGRKEPRPGELARTYLEEEFEQ